MTTYDAHETERMLALEGSELATFTRRGGAFITDIAIMAALFGGVGILGEPLFIAWGWIKESDQVIFALNRNWYSIAWTLAYFTLATWIGNGKTPGKLLFGIRIVCVTHERMSFWHSFERSLGYGYSFLECFFGFFQYFIYPNRRTLHDRVAETIVVRSPRTRKATGK